MGTITTRILTGKRWGQHVEKGAGTGWVRGPRHTVRGSNGVNGLSPCHSV